MSCQNPVYQWTSTITTHFPQLSKPQARVLALWSLGMVLARSCALSAVSTLLGQWLDRQPNPVRQQLREFCYEAGAKRGTARQEVVVETCFAPLLAWVLGWWDGSQLALAVDASTLGNGLWSWLSACSLVAVQFPWRGPCCPLERNMRGDGSGCACCAR